MKYAFGFLAGIVVSALLMAVALFRSMSQQERAG